MTLVLPPWVQFPGSVPAYLQTGRSCSDALAWQTSARPRLPQDAGSPYATTACESCEHEEQKVLPKSVRQMTFNSHFSITPLSPLHITLGEGSHDSILSASYAAPRDRSW